MTTPDASVQEDGSLEELVGRVADEFLSSQRQGERPDAEEYANRYPQARRCSAMCWRPCS